MSADPVLVAGGGIGGLAAALALARKGRAVRVFEQGAEFREIGAGIQLGPNVYRMFEALGLTHAIERYSVHPDNLVMKDALTGEDVIRVPVGGDAFRERFGGYLYGVIHRGDLYQVLLETCRAHDRIELNALTRCLSYEERGDRVVLQLEGGGRVEGCALIGADGLWSKVRAQLLADGKPRVSGHIAYRAVLPRAEVPGDLWQNNVVLWAGPRTHLVHYPLRRGELYNLVAVFHSDRYEEGWDVYGDPAELHAKFASERPEVRRLLEKINVWKMWVLCDREPAREWSRGRVTLLGDAAHPMLQYLAQGANMALEDAVVLAAYAELAGWDFARAFRWYQDARYLRTARVQVTARYYGDIYHAAGVVREVRNWFLASKPGADPNARPSFEGVAWLYDGIRVPTAPPAA
ncbi:MAG: 3-hydroxybenzoate 6-monooxygenase [Betaproteobacteria bacterium]|nr:MAG: 3-hydroxybenzoate 6-monooxygenase [Betaproteobacteria bacterium]